MEQDNSNSILIPLREAQSFAKTKGNEVATAVLAPKEWLILARELEGEGRKVEADEASALELFVGETKVLVEFETVSERQLFRALFIIRTQYGQVCPEFELCRHASCQASVGAWMTADEALQIYG
jgi:hypothetical protein